MSLDERISQRGRMVRNDMAKFAGEIDGKRKEIKALSGRHVGPGSEHGIRDETARLESEIGVLQLQEHDREQESSGVTRSRDDTQRGQCSMVGDGRIPKPLFRLPSKQPG